MLFIFKIQNSIYTVELVKFWKHFSKLYYSHYLFINTNSIFLHSPLLLISSCELIVIVYCNMSICRSIFNFVNVIFVLIIKLLFPIDNILLFLWVIGTFFFWFYLCIQCFISIIVNDCF